MSTLSPNPSTRRVSFSDMPSPTIMQRKPSVSPGKGVLKLPSVKRDIPPYLYSHPDPLLRRLRLRDQFGHEVDLKKEFRDCTVIGFLFSAAWAGVRVKEVHEAMALFAKKHPHQFKCIFVSVDTDEDHCKANVANKPFLSMEWNDGSNLPVSEYEDASTECELARNENFLLASEYDQEGRIGAEDVRGETYLRPYARVHLATKFDVLSVPSLVVYHLPTKTVLDNRVQMRKVLDDHAMEKAYAQWIEGQSTAISFRDLLYTMKWTVALAVIALLYHLARMSGNDTVGRFMDLVLGQHAK